MSMMFFDTLVRYEIALWNAVDRDLARRQRIGLGQLHALRLVAHYEGQARVQDLSDDIGITVGAASKLVDRLERDDLVSRRPNPANRRSSLIALTSGGRRALKSASKTCDAALARAVGDEDVAAATAVLQRLQLRLTETGMAA